MEITTSVSPQLCGHTKRELARGGFGLIEIIEQDGREVVRKRLNPELDIWSTPERLEEEKERFAREIELMKELTHPNIPTILESFEYAFAPDLESLPAYTMPVARESLQAFWDKQGGSKSWQRYTAYYLGCLYQVAYTLAFIHSRDTIHRDLKPANILLFDDGTAMLSDFGASKNTDNKSDDLLTRTGLSINTRGFTAPEQLQSLKHATKRSDVYSFGATLFYLMTGELAGGPDKNVHLEKLKSVPSPLADFVCKCLSFNPLDRYKNGTELTLAFLKTLSAVTDELSIEKYPVPQSYPKALSELLRFGEVEFITYLANFYTQQAPIGISNFIELLSGEVLQNVLSADPEHVEKLLQMVLIFNTEEYRESQTWVNSERGAKFYRMLLRILKQHPQKISNARLNELEFELAESVLHSATLNHRFEAGREFVRLFDEKVSISKEILKRVFDSNPSGRKFIQGEVDYTYIPLPVDIKGALQE